MLPEYLAYLAILFSLIGTSFYIRDIFRGKTKPNAVSWVIWMIAPFVGVFLELKAGAGLSVIPVAMAGFIPVLVIVAAIIKRNAVWRITNFDIFCGILSVIALVLYVLTRNTAISISFAIASDFLAGVPTLVKSWRFPETETAGAYIPGIVNNTIALFVIRHWTYSIYSFSIYFIVENLAILFCIYHKKFFPTKFIS